jgi:hypothetical protein
VRTLDAHLGAADTDADAKRLFQRADVRIVLTQQVGQKPGIVEVEFQRVFAGSVGNCVAV